MANRVDDRKDIRWRLARDAVVVALEEFNPTRLRGQIIEGWANSEACYVLYRPGSRSGPMAVNARVRNLLRRFRSPTTFIEAVISTARAEDDNPHHILKQLQPVVFGLVQRGILVQADASRRDTAPAAMHTLRTGSRFRDYVVKATIRSLRDSEVYLVERVRDGMPCVLKIEGRHCVGTIGKQRIQQALLREFHVLDELRGTPACELIEQGRWRGRVFGILSHVGFRHVQREARRIMDAADSDRAARLSILQLFCDCLSALEKIHAHGYLHGDIHPGNFLVDETGKVRLVDFGGAQRVDHHGKGLLGHQGGVVHYLPPEVAADRIDGNRQIGWTIASEIYAIAALGYELLTGQRHLPSRMYKEDALAQIVATPARTFAGIGVAPWPDIERVLCKALDTKPSQRYHSVRSFRTALLRARSSTAKEATPIARPDVTVHSRLEDARRSFIEEVSAIRLHRSAGNASINLGSTGVAYSLWRAATQQDDPHLLAEASRWIGRALVDAEDLTAFRLPVGTHTNDTSRIDSLFFGRPGIQLVAALIAHALSDSRSRDHALSGLAEHAPAPDAPAELLHGVAGHLVGASVLFAETGAPEALRLGQRYADHLLQNAFGHGGATPWEEVKYYGFAHGWGGIYFSLVQWASLTHRTLPGWFVSALRSFAQSGIPAGGKGLNWPVYRASTAQRPFSGWCHGSPGLTLLWVKAYEHFGDDLFLHAARSCGWHTLERVGKLGSLCCGHGGKAYALLALSRIDLDGPWLPQATELATQAVATRDVTTWPQSLLKGRAGIFCLAGDILHEQSCRFPLIEV
jgi:hypothetical protein